MNRCVETLADSITKLQEHVLSELPEEHAPIVLDVSDGSLLSIHLASILSAKKKNKDDQLVNGSTKRENEVIVVSKETKLFSRLFHTQLADANKVDDHMYFWDGHEDLSEILTEILLPDSSDEKEEQENKAQDETNPESVLKQPVIVALLSECFHFQISEMPTWQAVKHLYTCRSLAPALHPLAVLAPSHAQVMVAAIELTNLHVSHGLVDR